MSISRKEMRGSRAYTVPLFGIVALLALYWLLTDWQQVPAILRSALDAVNLSN
jgi:ABC-type nitrate/sulfonate/bicarbonate transport system permease component